MNQMTRDDLHRTIKLEVDEGRAATFAEAAAIASAYRLQIAVGPNVRQSETRQAALLTAVNAGARAFLGGVRVVGDLSWPMTSPWAHGLTATEAVTRFGGVATEDFDQTLLTAVIGDYSRSEARVTIWPTWQGWATGVVDDPSLRLPELIEFPLSGVAAGALTVSEAFQLVRGNVLACRRTVGVSLWNPGSPWTDSDAWGQPPAYLPSQLWVLGLGHLGQAYLWALGFVPYEDPGSVTLTLQDTDLVVKANVATGLLCDHDAVGHPKTRVAAAAMERLGFSTRLVERRFNAGYILDEGDPIWAIAGFDNIAARRSLGTFVRVVDAGLGAGSSDYLSIRVQALPAAGDVTELFGSREVAETGLDAPAYATLVDEMIASGMSPEDARCGVIEVSGATVGAAFVGAFAASLVVANVLRSLIDDGGPTTISLSLGAPNHIGVASGDPCPVSNPGYAASRRLASVDHQQETP